MKKLILSLLLIVAMTANGFAENKNVEELNLVICSEDSAMAPPSPCDDCAVARVAKLEEEFGCMTSIEYNKQYYFYKKKFLTY